MNKLTTQNNKGAGELLSLDSLYSKLTLQTYKSDMYTFNKLTKKTYLNYTAEDISKYIQLLRDSNYTQSTITKKLYTLSACTEKLILAKKRTDNPVKILKKIKRNLIPKTIHTIKQTLTTQDMQKIKKNNDRTALIIQLLACTGMRISESLGIKKTHIKTHNDNCYQIVIVGKGNKARTIYAPKKLINKIQEYTTSQATYLITNSKSTQAIRTSEYNKITKYFIKALHKSINPHQCRHYYATTQIVKNNKTVKSVSRYLGHSSTAITQDMYVNSSMTSQEAILT